MTLPPFLWPVPGYYAISSRYTDARDYGLHIAINIPAPSVPVVAIAAGTVIFTGWAGSAGRMVWLQLPGGYRVHYAHLQHITVISGHQVAAGQHLAHVGGSGHGIDCYYGNHLHLNLFLSERPPTGPSQWVPWVSMWAVDPERYLAMEDDMTEEQWKLLQDTHHHVHVMIPQLLMALEINNRTRNDQLRKEIAAIGSDADGTHRHK